MSLPLEPLATAVLHIPEVPERILEIDCGEGDGVFFLAREFPAARVRGVDPSAEALKGAVSRIGLDPEGRVAFKPREGRGLPYPDSHFDLVVQRRGTLRPHQIARVLRPGGHLLQIASPPGGILRFGGRRSLRRLRRLGFETVEMGEGDRWSFTVWRLASRA